MALQDVSRFGVNVSAGTLQANTGTVVFSNSNGLTFGMSVGSSSAIITASGAGLGNAIQSLSAGTTQITSGEAVLSNSNGIAFGVSGQTVTAGFVGVRYWNNFHQGDMEAARPNIESSTNNLSLQPACMMRPLTATRADMFMMMSMTGSTAGSFTISLAAYTLTGATAVLASSTAVAVTWASGTVTSATSQYAGQSGTRIRSLALASWSFTPGEYLLGVIISALAPPGSTVRLSAYGRPAADMGLVGTGSTSVIGYENFFGYGFYTAATGAFPASIRTQDQVFALNFAADIVNIAGFQPMLQLAGTY